MVYSQDQDFNKRLTIGAYSNVGINHPIRLTRKYVTDDVGPFHSNLSWTIGLSFSRMLSEKLYLEIAPGYSLHRVGFELSPPIYSESKVYYETLNILSIPLTVYRYFKSDFFLNLGTIVDFDLTRKSWIDSQNGLGLNLGAGKEFQVKSFVFDIAPNLEIHSVIPFNSVNDQQRLLVFGLKLGLSNIFYKPNIEKNNSNLNMTDN